MQLVTIAFSHYNEKARWALDRFGVDYVDRRYLPVLHFGGVIWATRGRGGQRDRASTRWSTPLLITDDGTRLHDSSEIVRYASDRFGTEQTSLYPAKHVDQIERIEREVGQQIGPYTRRIVYYYLLAEPARLSTLCRDNSSWMQWALFVSLGPFARMGLRKGLGVTRSRMEVAVEKVRAQVESLSRELGDRPYLVGDRFTAADIAVACMLAPAVVPMPEEGYSAILPSAEDRPVPLAAFVDEVRASPIGQHALRMFAQERRLPAGS